MTFTILGMPVSFAVLKRENMKLKKFPFVWCMASTLLLTQACNKMQTPDPAPSPTLSRAVTTGLPPSAGSGAIVSIYRTGLAALLAGDGTPGLVNSSGQFARFKYPSGTATDRDGNVFVADQLNHVIRKIDRFGQATTYAGTGKAGADNGALTTASFNGPCGIAIDKITGIIYVADFNNDRIRTISGGVVNTLAGGFKGDVEGWGTSAKFNGPSAVALDNSGFLIVADQNNNCIKRIAGMYVTKLSGGTINTPGYVDGSRTTSRFNGPSCLTVGPDGGVYVGDGNNKVVRRVDFTGNTTTYVYANNNMGVPSGLAMDSSQTLYVTSYTNHAVYQKLPNGASGRLVGSGIPGYAVGIGDIAQFNSPVGAALDNHGNLFVSDRLGHRVRQIELEAYGQVKTWLGDGKQGLVDKQGMQAEFYNPAAIATDKDGNEYIADAGNHVIRKVSLFGFVSTLAGSTKGFKDSDNGALAQFNTPTGVAVDGQGNVYVADCNNHRIRKITPSGAVTTVAGQTTRGSRNGAASQALFDYPLGIGIDLNGNLFIAGGNENRIRKIATDGTVSTVAGTGISGNADGGPGVAQFHTPAALSIDRNGTIFVADRDNNSIRTVSQSGQVATFAGSTRGFLNAQGKAAQFNMPTGVVVDAADIVYVADRGNNRIRRISRGGVVTTQAGSGNSTLTNGGGFFSGFNMPFGIGMNIYGNLLICDWGNNCVRILE
jgi:sugar lactone lactonase YvrE